MPEPVLNNRTPSPQRSPNPKLPKMPEPVLNNFNYYQTLPSQQRRPNPTYDNCTNQPVKPQAVPANNFNYDHRTHPSPPRSPTYDYCPVVPQPVLPNNRNFYNRGMMVQPQMNSPIVYDCLQFVPNRNNGKGKHTLHDKFIISNLDCTRRLRDLVILNLREYVIEKIEKEGKYFSYKIRVENDQSSTRETIGKATTFQEFDNCEMSNDFGSLLYFVKKVCQKAQYIKKADLEILTENKNGASHGTYIESNKGRTQEEINGLFNIVYGLLKELNKEDSAINDLHNTWIESCEIREQQKQLKRMQKEEMRKILYFLEDNLDDPAVQHMLKGTVAPRIKNVIELIGNNR
jgi:hypothetical protein